MTPNFLMPERTTSQTVITGAETYRSSSTIVLDRWGDNLQNVNDRVRRHIVPDPGHVFIQCDQAGAEARIVAYIIPVGKLRALFECGIKSHTFVAMHFFQSHWEQELGEPLDEYIKASPEDLRMLPLWPKLSSLIAKHPKYYMIGKIFCHSSNYGARGPSLAATALQRTDGRIVLKPSQATAFSQFYHTLFPEISMWWQDVREVVMRGGRLKNLFGHPSVSFEDYPKTEKTFMEANALIPQSTVGCLTHYAYTELQRQIDKKDLQADLLNNCHDSILSQCIDDPETIAITCDAMKQAFESHEFIGYKGVKFRMKTEISVGYNWGKYHPTENPAGLREVA